MDIYKQLLRNYSYYSKVYKAKNGKTGKLMALKRIRMKTEKDGVSTILRVTVSQTLTL
jgi:serine/threonine protein kinase